ncbi:PKD-like family lipoprotein [Chitinophagaceae bacterium 26-R-25]|nr:PKD-like family lipoprotein [Chitinophagaceae bacterium 26-R-25]
MRINFLRIFHATLLLAMAGMGGCYKDNGNYDYKAINDLTISYAQGTSQALQVNYEDTLKVQPAIVQSLGKDESGLSFEWSVWNSSQGQAPNAAVTVLSNDRNLALKVVYPFAIGSQYTLVYKVTVKETGVSTYLKYIVTVTNRFSQGWVLLEDVGGNTDYSMILLDNTVVHNLYAGLNGAPMAGKPKGMYISTFPVTDDISVPSRKMYLFSESDGAELDYIKMSRKFALPALFYKPPTTLNVSHMKWFAGTISMLVNNGKLNVDIVGGFPGAKKFGETLLTPDGDLNYNLAPFSVGGNTVYDNQGKRFLFVPSTGTGMTRFSAQASTLFDMNNVEMDMLYMSESSIPSESDALLKDASNTVYYMRVKTNTTVASPVATLKKVSLAAAPDIAQMSAAASSIISPHLYYGAANKLYRYETTSNTVLPQYTFPAQENITVMKCPVPMLGAPQLVVITWNGTESKAYFFQMSSTGDLVLVNTFGGFGKVVDFGMRT